MIHYDSVCFPYLSESLKVGTILKCAVLRYQDKKNIFYNFEVTKARMSYKWTNHFSRNSWPLLKLIQREIICNDGRVNSTQDLPEKKELYVTPQFVITWFIIRKPDNWMCRKMPEQLDETYSTQPSWMTTRQGTGKPVVLAGTSPTSPQLLAVLT